MEFVVGDLVMLSICDLHMHDNCKFAAHFIGPFKVLKHVGKLAYRIELPPIYSALHNVFHVSKLKLYIPGGGDGTSTNTYSRFWLMVKNSMRFKKILAEYGHGNCKQYLVFWVGYLAEHDLWLPESELTQAPDVLAAWKLVAW